jgi:broad specificity phosphatase PhoE
MENENKNKEILVYSLDFSGKVLFMRHGKTWFNLAKPDPSRYYNPDLSDAHLCDEGIQQITSTQDELNKLNFEIVYVSPYYRTLQTVSLALEKHPKVSNLKIIVHPKLGEVICAAQEFIIDIKQAKKDFNMDSKVKIDWSYFDKYIKESNKYDENFFYFENIDNVDEKVKNETYLKLKKLYDEGLIDEFKKELISFWKGKHKKFGGYESSHHSSKRFEDLKQFLKNEHKDTFNDIENKILCVSHKSFIKAAIDHQQKLVGKSKKKFNKSYQMKNGEIISIFI